MFIDEKDKGVTLRVVLDHEGTSEARASARLLFRQKRRSHSVAPRDCKDGVVRAQTWLKGSISLIIGQEIPYESQETVSLTVQVVGEESTSVVPLLGVAANDKHIVFDETIVAHTFTIDSCLPSTTGCYSFSLFLPASAPPSMHFEEHGSSCKVQYFVIAKLGHLSIESCRLTVVGRPLSCKHYPCMVEPTCLPLRTMAGVVDHGCLVLAAKIDNRNVAKGRKVTLAVSCRNKSKESIERFDVQVLEHIWWKAGKASRESTVKLDSYCDVDIPGVKAFMPSDPTGASHHGHRPSSSSDDGRVGQSLAREMNEELQSKLHEFPVQIPSRAFDSYSGTLVRVTHFVKVLASTKQHRPSDPQHVPSISLPVEVFDPPMEPKSMRERSVSSEKMVREMATTIWPKDEDQLSSPLTCAKENHSSATPGHRKVHSDSELAYDAIAEMGPSECGKALEALPSE
jgi:hypothetical protein